MTSKLTKLVPPPNGPFEGGSGLNWAEIEKKLKTPLPADYKQFIAVYGTGTFAGFYFVYNPFSKSGSQNLLENVKKIGREYKELRAEDPDSYPYPVYPAKKGLLPWGNDENGNYYFWLTKGSPDEWQVVANESRGDGFVEYGCSFSAFLTGVLEGEIEALASNYPNESSHKFAVFVPPPPHPGEEMYKAIESRDRRRVKELLDGGFDPNGANLYGTKLFPFAVQQDTEMMQMFLQHGADPNQERDGTPVLERAVFSRDLSRIQMLLDAGAKINHPTEPVILGVASSKETALVRFLLEAGADPNVRDGRYGETSLHKAAFMRDTAMIRLLLEFGADASVRNNDGLDAAEYAEKERRGEEVIQILREAVQKK